MSLQVPLQDLQPAVAAAIFGVCVALEMLFQVMPTIEGLITLEATKCLATAARQFLLTPLNLWWDRRARWQGQLARQETK
jgi:hypothetical protein